MGNGTAVAEVRKADSLAAYGEAYRAWKGWTAERGFATLSPEQKTYFDRELARFDLGPGACVLDVGFGNGELLRYARDRGWRAAGTEMNPGLLEAARLAGFDAHPASAMAAVCGGSFDLVTAFDVLEHVPQDGLPDLLSAMAGALAPGGRLLCRFPNGDSPFGMPIQNGDLTHVTVIGEARMVLLAAAAGLELVWFGGEARVVRDPSWRAWIGTTALRLLEHTLEPCLKAALYGSSSRFSFFSPSSVAVMRRAG